MAAFDPLGRRVAPTPLGGRVVGKGAGAYVSQQRERELSAVNIRENEAPDEPF